MSAKNAKRQWDQTMKSSGLVAPGQAPKKRFSGRTVKISKAMKLVDEETRQQVRNARLDALEADNYVEQTEDDEDMFVLEDEEETRTKKPKSKSKAKSKATPVVPQALGRRRIVRKVKSLRQLIFEECGDGESSIPNYISAAVKPPKEPPRHFCAVCGHFSCYNCGRCGSKFCSVQCGDQHKETGCLKFNL
ncbi:unnamed protein product [Aphanomyces euteiches]|uniref:HIT-type domain-containing protein n=1 Tax=Aphanomyces euteiches TaxID=100861 RepID=A0A6G0X8S1_9STRA|nr:hypothetical protein Ae201684_007448 [Aphanomyces euteiches]KAH9100746.1 hypothetical protein Ae201684P_006940 [Aphanomyces euteiches]KAH9156651.1 hypothetical protein AeRB84_001452 [Aphanomyces euteiches]